MFFVKLPNFLSIETKPFDQAFYEDEIDEDEVLDDEGRARLKLKVCCFFPFAQLCSLCFPQDFICHFLPVALDFPL